MRSINPATLETIRVYEEHDRASVEERLRRARIAFESWRRLCVHERCDHLPRLARILRSELQSLASLITAEMGKPVREAELEIEKSATLCDYYAANGAEFLSPIIIGTDARQSYVTFEPLGLVLGIMPWNFPFWQVFRFAVPGITAGNAGVLKHSGNVSGCALAIEDLFQRAGYPKGVFTTLLVPGSRTSELVEHSLISAVTITGSDGAGRAVAERAGRVLKKCVLELGGSDPFIVLEDADIPTAVRAAVQARLVNSGQSCIAAKRFIVVDPIGECFEDELVQAMSHLRVGDPRDPETQVGPLARLDLVTELHDQVMRSVAQGAVVRLGGAPRFGVGCFYEPTVICGVRPGMAVFEEETFGPVAAVVRARDERDAILLANNSRWGLGASIWTGDSERALRLVSEIEAGMVFINGIVKSDPRLPFGGIKDSGYGRELSVQGIREFTNAKTVWIA